MLQSRYHELDLDLRFQHDKSQLAGVCKNMDIRPLITETHIQEVGRSAESRGRTLHFFPEYSW